MELLPPALQGAPLESLQALLRDVLPQAELPLADAMVWVTLTDNTMARRRIGDLGDDVRQLVAHVKAHGGVPDAGPARVRCNPLYHESGRVGVPCSLQQHGPAFLPLTVLFDALDDYQPTLGSSVGIFTAIINPAHPFSDMQTVLGRYLSNIGDSTRAQLRPFLQRELAALFPAAGYDMQRAAP